MEKDKLERAVIGFFAGAALGAGVSYLMLLLYNLVCGWTGRAPVAITWQQLLPLALLVGISLAINTANPPFGD